MTEILSFTPIPHSGEDLSALNGRKFVKGELGSVLWIEDQQATPSVLHIQGKAYEVFSPGLQLLPEGGRVTTHTEEPDVDEWIAPLWTLEDQRGYGSMYRHTGNGFPVLLSKEVKINDLVNARFHLSVKGNEDPRLTIVILDHFPFGEKVSQGKVTEELSTARVRSTLTYKLPSGENHWSENASNQTLYFVFKTRPLKGEMEKFRGLEVWKLRSFS